MKKTCLLLVLVLLLGVFSGCSGGSSGTIRMDIADPVENLDPQFTTDATARMIISNLYEGLVVQRADGSIEPGAAEAWEASADGLTYTFTLRDGLCWSDGEPLHAEDFVFAFHRIFGAGASSPWAQEFGVIRNARAVLSGSMGVTSLGVRAPDNATVVFELESPNALFLEALASTAAMPCSRSMFDEARGRYGLERKFVYSNGPFTLTRWDNSAQLTLTRSDNYVSDQAAVPNSVVLYVGREDPVSQFLDGKSDLVLLPAERVSEAERKNAQLLPVHRKVWCIVFNQDRLTWGNALLRQGMAATVDNALLADSLPADLHLTNSFIPEDMRLRDEHYRTYAGALDNGYDPERGEYLFSLGIATQELEQVPSSVPFLVPDTGSHALLAGLVQQSWQKYLGVYVNVEQTPLDTMESRLQSMDYQMMLLPFSSSIASPGSLLSVFRSDAAQNHFGYRNERFDSALDEAQGQATIDAAFDCYLRAETMLVGDATVIPLYWETEYFALNSSVSGLDISPFAGQICFKYASK